MVPARLEQTWLDRMAHYGPDMMAYWGGYDRLQSFPVDEPTAASRVVIAEDVIDNRFRREWIVPHGIVDLVGLPHARTPSLLGSIVFARHESIGVATDTDLATVRLIAPHIRRAVEISNLLDMKAIEASTFAATLETLAIGVVLVDARGTIVHGNAPARSMLDAKDPIRGERGVLKLASAASSAALEDAISYQRAMRPRLGSAESVCPCSVAMARLVSFTCCPADKFDKGSSAERPPPCSLRTPLFRRRCRPLPWLSSTT
jgi:PAS domain-containing protein